MIGPPRHTADNATRAVDLGPGGGTPTNGTASLSILPFSYIRTMCSCAEQVDRVRKDDWPVQCWSTERKRRLKRTDGDRMEMRVGGRHGDVRGRETLCHQLPHQSCHTIFFYAGRLPFYKSPGNHDSPIKKAPKPRPLYSSSLAPSSNISSPLSRRSTYPAWSLLAASIPHPSFNYARPRQRRNPHLGGQHLLGPAYAVRCMGSEGKGCRHLGVHSTS